MGLDPAVALLRELVAIDSVNPSLAAGGAGEGQIAARVADALRALGADVTVAEAAPGRPNVVGVLEGRAPGRTLMLCGHLDTVGVAGMDGPFDPRITDGRLYGRGAQDMKGGLAAQLDALRLLASCGLPRGRLVFAGVADEEYASVGAEALVQGWRADAAVICEPTELAVAVAHKGFSWVEVVTRGRAAHGSRPRDGRDAILHMGRVLSGLERLDAALQARPPHPLLGTPSLHASLVEGGREMSTYPDRCQLQMERRTLPGEAPETAVDEVEGILAVLRRGDPEFEAAARLTLGRPAYETPASCELPARLAAALRSRGRTGEPAGASFWTDAAILGPAGTPSVIFGPGGEGLHGPEEHVRLDEVLACRDVLVQVAADFCSEAP